MPPPSYFCKLCSKDVEEAGIRSEHTALRAEFMSLSTNRKPPKMAGDMLVACPSLASLSGVGGELDPWMQELIRKGGGDFSWGELLTIFQESMKKIHPQAHLKALVDTFD